MFSLFGWATTAGWRFMFGMAILAMEKLVIVRTTNGCLRERLVGIRCGLAKFRFFGFLRRARVDGLKGERLYMCPIADIELL